MALLQAGMQTLEFDHEGFIDEAGLPGGVVDDFRETVPVKYNLDIIARRTGLTVGYIPLVVMQRRHSARLSKPGTKQILVDGLPDASNKSPLQCHTLVQQAGPSHNMLRSLTFVSLFIFAGLRAGEVRHQS